MRLLARCDRSESEVRARLAALDIAPATIDTAIQRLRDLRYLDDRRVAAGTAARAWERGHGSDYVRAQLTAKGVAEALIEDCIAAAFGDEEQRAREVLARRFPEEPQRPAERAKAARFLLQRGFPPPVVLAILGEGC